MRNLISSALLAVCVAGASMTLTNNAHARNQILTGTIEAQHFCHDGANRGASVAVVISHRYPPAYGKRKLYGTNAKHYYAGTTCLDMATLEGEGAWGISPGGKITVWYIHDGYNYHLCRDFIIKYVKNDKQVWIQNGGTTVWNVTCVAKDGL